MPLQNNTWKNILQHFNENCPNYVRFTNNFLFHEVGSPKFGEFLANHQNFYTFVLIYLKNIFLNEIVWFGTLSMKTCDFSKIGNFGGSPIRQTWENRKNCISFLVVLSHTTNWQKDSLIEINP